MTGLEVNNQTTPRQQQQQQQQQQINSDTFQQHNNETQSQNHWGENRLADVVKGTVKSKSNNNSNREIVHDHNESPRATSPQHFVGGKQQVVSVQQDFATESSKDTAAMGSSEKVHTSTVTLTPPSSPEKLVCFLFFLHKEKIVRQIQFWYWGYSVGCWQFFVQAERDLALESKTKAI